MAFAPGPIRRRRPLAPGSPVAAIGATQTPPAVTLVTRKWFPGLYRHRKMTR